MRSQRIISLTPSITETIFALGAGHKLIAVTDACDYPPAANSKPHVCSWFNPDIERIRELKPDLVLGLASAHGPLTAELQRLGAECVLFNPATIEQAFDDIERLAALLSAQKAGQTLLTDLRRRLTLLDGKVRHLESGQRLTVLRVLDSSNRGLIVAGPQSFQYDVIARAGGINLTGSLTAAYPSIDYQQLQDWDPAVIFLCGTDPTYLTRLAATPRWQALSAVRSGRLYQFDCGLTCRTGPRIVDMAELLFTTLYGQENLTPFSGNRHG